MEPPLGVIDRSEWSPYIGGVVVAGFTRTTDCIGSHLDPPQDGSIDFTSHYIQFTRSLFGGSLAAYIHTRANAHMGWANGPHR